VLVPEGLFAAPSPGTEERATFLPLPPPDDERPPPRKRRCAFLEGFSLHANTHTHASDRHSLAGLCRYGARGPLSLERLSWRDDGRLAYRLKRPAPDGSTHLVLTPLELLRLLAALVPGVLAPNAKLRPLVVPQPPPAAPPPCVPPPPADPLPRSTRRLRLPWAEVLRRSFSVDVLTCSKCGGLRRVLAYITDPPVVRAILDPLHLPSRPLPIAPARGPPQASFPADLCA